MKNYKIQFALTFSLFALNIFATDYDDDKFDNHIQDQGVNEVLEEAQFILCSLSRFGTKELAGDGSYKATIYSDECEGAGATATDSTQGTTAPTSANSTSSSSSTAATGGGAATTAKEVDEILINTGFVSSTLQKTKAWIINDEPFDRDEFTPKSITYLLNEQTAASSDTNKFGNFTLRYQEATYGNTQEEFVDKEDGGYHYECPPVTSRDYKYSWCADGNDVGRGILIAADSTIKFKNQGRYQQNVVAEYSENGDIAGIYTKNTGFQDDSLRDPECDGIEGDWWECQPQEYRDSSTQVLGIFSFGISSADKSYCTKMSELYKVDWSQYDEATQGPALTPYELTGTAGERLENEGWDVSEKCFSIDKADAIKDIWDYGVYNSDGSRYEPENQSFPIRAKVTIDGVARNAHGYASYWGVHVDDNYQDVIDDSTEWVREGDNSETPSKYSVTARKLVVEKREKKYEALNDLDGLNLNFWTNDSYWSDEFYKLGFAKTEPWEGKIQFKSNKAVMTDYNNGTSSDPLTIPLYGVHNGKGMYVVDMTGTKLDRDNLRKIIKNESSDPGKAMNLTMEFAEFPKLDYSTENWERESWVRFYLCTGSGIGSTSGDPYSYDQLTFADTRSGRTCLRLEGALKLSSNGDELVLKSEAKGDGRGNYYANFRDFDSGTELWFQQEEWNNSGYEYDIKIVKSGIERPAGLEVKLQSILNAFGSLSQFDDDGGDIQRGLESFLDSSNTFTYLLTSGIDMYDVDGNRFNKISGTFGVDADPALAIFVDDIQAIEGSVDTYDEFIVSLNKTHESDVTFDYEISTNSTASSEDYSGLSAGTVTIPAGTKSAAIGLNITGDALAEGQIDEKIILTLSNPVGANLARSNVTAFIYDDDTNRVVYEDYRGSYNASTGTFSITEGMIFQPSYQNVVLPAPIVFTNAQYLAAMQKTQGVGEDWEYTDYRDLHVWSQDTNQSYSITRNSLANPASSSKDNGVSSESWTIVPMSELPANLNCINECLKTSLVKAHYDDVKSQADPVGDGSYTGTVSVTSPRPFADVGPYIKANVSMTTTYNEGTEDEWQDTKTWSRGDYNDGILASDVYTYTSDGSTIKDAAGENLEIDVDWKTSRPYDYIRGSNFKGNVGVNDTWTRESEWGVNTGTLVDDLTLAKLECDYSIIDGVKVYNDTHPEYTSANGKINTTRYCQQKIWNSKEIDVSYNIRLETYKQYEIAKTDGSNVLFERPKALYFTAPDTSAFGDDAGKKFRLELHGDHLGGIPGSVIDLETGNDLGEYVEEWKDNYRWVQRFTVPDGSVLTQNTSEDTFIVKALGGQEWLGKKDSAIGSLSNLLSLKSKSDLLTNVDLDWEVSLRPEEWWNCSIKIERVDDNGNTYEDTDWEKCDEVESDDPNYSDIWTLEQSFENCTERLQYEEDYLNSLIAEMRANAIAGGNTYDGPASAREWTEEDGNGPGDWLNRELLKCKSIGPLPTNLINGGNAAVINGTVVFDPSP